MATMNEQQFVEMIVKAIVDHPDDVKTEKTLDDRGTLISLILNPEDMGKIIGKGGRTVNSIRKLLHVFGAKSDDRINLKIFEPDGGEVRTPDESTEERSNASKHHEHQQEVMSEDVPKHDEEEQVEQKPKKTDSLDDVPTEVLV